MGDKANTVREECVPFRAFEDVLFTANKNDKRNKIIIIVLIALLFLSNAAWLLYESQFTTTEDEVTYQSVWQDNTDGYNNYIGNDGDIVYGESAHPNMDN